VQDIENIIALPFLGRSVVKGEINHLAARPTTIGEKDRGSRLTDDLDPSVIKESSSAYTHSHQAECQVMPKLVRTS